MGDDIAGRVLPDAGGVGLEVALDDGVDLALAAGRRVRLAQLAQHVHQVTRPLCPRFTHVEVSLRAESTPGVRAREGCTQRSRMAYRVAPRIAGCRSGVPGVRARLLCW